MEQQNFRPHRESQLTISIFAILHKAPPRLMTKATETSINGPDGQIKISGTTTVMICGDKRSKIMKYG